MSDSFLLDPYPIPMSSIFQVISRTPSEMNQRVRLNFNFDSYLLIGKLGAKNGCAIQIVHYRGATEQDSECD